MKEMKIMNTLRFKLATISVFLIMVPIISVSLIYSHTVKEIIKTKYTETAIDSVYETGEKIDFILNDIEEFSTVIISNAHFLDMLKNKEDYSRNDFKNELRSFITLRDDIEVIDLTINGITTSVGAKKILKFKEYNKDLEESTGEAIWSPTRVEKIKILSGRFEKNFFSVGRKIVDFNTLDEYGYLSLDFEETILEQAYNGVVDNDAEILICDKFGRIISHTNKEKIKKSIVDEPYANEVLSDKTGHNYALFKSEEEKVAIYSTINKQGWKIVKIIPTQYLYEEINKNQNYILIGGIIYGIIIIIFMILFSFRYTEPMIKMKSVIQKVEQGDLSVRTEINSNDEIGQLGSSLNNMISEMQVLIDKLVEEEKEKRDLELEALHAQINPHFLYNTLNTIKWMAKIQGNVSVSSAVTALVKLLRISIDLGKDMITLGEEVDYVKNYMVIQRLRFNESIIVNYDIDILCLDYLVPKLILQPIVENAIIYGISDENLDLHIDIKVYQTDEELIVEVKDDGPGIEEEVLKNILKESDDKNRFSKVGLNNVNQRIKLYCGEEYGIRFKTKANIGTKVIVILEKKSL